MIKKIVYDDNGRIKVIKGEILKEDEFTYTILGSAAKDKIVIGKRYIVSIKGDLE